MQQRTQVECQDVTFKIKPRVRTVKVKLTSPTLTDLPSDATRLLLETQQHKVDCEKIDLDVLRGISSTLRECQWEVNVSVKAKEVISISPISNRSLGLAVDVGTTKIAGYLVDLTNGKTLASKGMMNPQISYGEDIISRIMNAIKSAEDAAKLKNLAIGAINQIGGELCVQINAKPEEILDVVLVGNTAIHHLMLGLPVKQLVYSPYIAAVQESLEIKSRDIGLCVAPGAYVHVLPNVAGFVGADHVAMLLAIDADKIKETTLAIDIGTNTEISLISDGIIRSASCASGPAFEGGQISNGMRAASGAIEHLRIVDGEIKFQTIDNVPAVGICGSGVIDTLASVYEAGMVEENGRILPDKPHVRRVNGQLEIVIAEARNEYPPITFTQKDIRELQLAKAAIRSGIQVLLESAGRTEKEIEQLIIAGAFGTYIDVKSATAIGVLPTLPLERFRQVGNAAGLGARMALLSKSKMLKAQELAKLVHYIELATCPHFTQIFLQASYLGEFQRKAISQKM
jgi:uncharacterized 2Fe-2S/4Fe-4S cluster protein (DUF4445 family)